MKNQEAFSQLTSDTSYTIDESDGQLDLRGLLPAMQAAPPVDDVAYRANQLALQATHDADVARHIAAGYTWDSRDRAWRDADGSL